MLANNKVGALPAGRLHITKMPWGLPASMTKQLDSVKKNFNAATKDIEKAAKEVHKFAEEKVQPQLKQRWEEGKQTVTSARKQAIEDMNTHYKGYMHVEDAQTQVNRQDSWNMSFTNAVATLRNVAKTMPREIKLMRGVTDIPIPMFILPSGPRMTPFKINVPMSRGRIIDGEVCTQQNRIEPLLTALSVLPWSDHTVSA